jgi:hypothetical protein
MLERLTASAFAALQPTLPFFYHCRKSFDLKYGGMFSCHHHGSGLYFALGEKKFA